MIEVKNLKKSYGSMCVLDDINLTMEKGDIYGLVGRSGAGKSTLLRCMNGLEPYQSGSLTVNGMEVSSLSGSSLREFQKNIGMIFQNFALLSRRSVYHNIALSMKVWGMDKPSIGPRVEELLELVGIPEKVYDKPGVLSGGQKQRVAIARALALNPNILLCDEATSALDPKTTQSILSLLRQINDQLGLTIIVVTHQMSVVRQICNKVAILEGGKIVETGSVEDIFLRQPPAFREFLGKPEMPLPATGVNIRLQMPQKLAMTGFLSSIVRRLDLDIPIITEQMEAYRDSVLCTVVINVPQEEVARTLGLLKEKHVTWEVLTEAHPSKTHPSETCSEVADCER